MSDDDDHLMQLTTRWFCLFQPVGCDWHHDVTTELDDFERGIIASKPEPWQGIEIVSKIRNRRLELVLGAHMAEHGFVLDDVELIRALSEPGT